MRRQTKDAIFGVVQGANIYKLNFEIQEKNVKNERVLVYELRKHKYKNRKVLMTESQYFENVPEVAWSFYIGGYQPAQK